MGALRWDSRGRAGVQLEDGAVLAHFFRFRHNKPKHEVNLARSSVVKLKHAQNKFCGLAAVIQSRIEKGQSAGDRDDVSRETIAILFSFSEMILHSVRLTPAFRFSLSF